MSQITRVPFGLQSLLGSKNFGDNPAELGQVVAPILDMFPFFAAERRTWHQDVGIVVNDNGVVNTITVPTGELWLVDSLGASVQMTGSPAGDFGINISWYGARLNNSTNGTQQHALGLCNQLRYGTPAALTTPDEDYVSHDFARPVPFFASERLVCNANGITGNINWVVSPTIRYYKLEV